MSRAEYRGSGVSPLQPGEHRRDGSATLPRYFDPHAAVAFLSGDLPHWRQAGTTYFVTFRLADSLPQEKLAQWRNEREQWRTTHPEPHDEATRLDYYERFPQRFQQWLDADAGSCVLASAEAKAVIADVLRHFDGQRYTLGEFVVAPNHVHVLLTPLGEHTLSTILHSWKSFSAHELGKMMKSGSGVPPLASADARSVCHPGVQSGSGVSPLQPGEQRRDASASAPTSAHKQQGESPCRADV